MHMDIHSFIPQLHARYQLQRDSVLTRHWASSNEQDMVLTLVESNLAHKAVTEG